MSFLKDYTLSVMIVSLVAILLENLLPQDSNQKYCNVLIGLFVMLVILNPLTRLPHFSESFAIPSLRIGENDLSVGENSYVARSFEKNLALAISRDLRDSFGGVYECRVFCRVNSEGQITEIAGVRVSPFSENVRKHIAEKYGIGEESIGP